MSPRFDYAVTNDWNGVANEPSMADGHSLKEARRDLKKCVLLSSYSACLWRKPHLSGAWEILERLDYEHITR